MAETLENVTEGALSSQALSYLEGISQNSDAAFAANMAMAMSVSLRSSQAAIATGKEVSVLGVPSQTLLTDIILTMPIRDETTTPASKLLFDHFCKQSGAQDKLDVAEFLASFVRDVNAATTEHNPLSITTRYQNSMNFQPAIVVLNSWVESYLDSYFDNDELKLAHEGGDISQFAPELYTQFASTDYIQLLMQTSELGGKAALSGQVRLKLLNEMDYLRQLETELYG
jgi:hypothetical protein